MVLTQLGKLRVARKIQAWSGQERPRSGGRRVGMSRTLEGGWTLAGERNMETLGFNVQKLQLLLC